MTVALLIAGIGLLLAGLLAVGFGIPVKEFSFGNTLILVGAVAACTGMLMLGLWTVVRELKNISWQLGAGVPQQLPPAGLSAALGDRDQPTAHAEQAEPAGPWPPPGFDEASRDRGEVSAASASAEAAPAAKPRRNLLFSSLSRKERERAQVRTVDPSAADLRPHRAGPPAAEPGEAPPPAFEDAWPKSERARTADAPPRRPARAPSTFTEAAPGAPAGDRSSPAARNEGQPPVTVLKSGVVDGMAYSLYSDGSIEAQMPEGMMRFASIDELRSHLEQRP